MKKHEALYEIIENLYRLGERDLEHLNSFIEHRYDMGDIEKQGRVNSYLLEYLDMYADNDERRFITAFVYEYLKRGEDIRNGNRADCREVH